jgi:hypothetical protein
MCVLQVRYRKNRFASNFLKELKPAGIKKMGAHKLVHPKRLAATTQPTSPSYFFISFFSSDEPAHSRLPPLHRRTTRLRNLFKLKIQATEVLDVSSQDLPQRQYARGSWPTQGL